MPTLPCPKWVSPTIGTESAPVGVGVCHPGPPHFVWKRGTARGAFGSFGPKSHQGAKTFGPTFRANLSTAGGTQWCPVVQLGARECGADGLWVTFTGLPQAVVLGGWSQNPNKIEGPQSHVVVQPRTDDWGKQMPIGPCSSRPPHAAAVVVLPNHLHCTGIVANDVGTPFERWQCRLQRWVAFLLLPTA